MPFVLVDANAIAHGDWLLEGAAWRVLAYRARNRQCTLIIPEVVVREVVGRFRACLVAAVDKLTAASKPFGQLGVELEPPQVNVDREVASYRGKLDAAIRAACGSAPQPPDIKIMDLVERAIDRRRPFDAKGSGFRDAVVWEHVMEELARPGDQWGTLVSADRAAFWQGSEIAPDLATDLRRRGLRPERLALVKSVSDFIKETGSSDPALDAEITDLVEASHQWIRSLIKVSLAGEEVETDTNLALASIEDVDEINVVVAGTYASPDKDGLVLVELDCSAVATLSVVLRTQSDHAIESGQTPTIDDVAFIDTQMHVTFPASASYRKAGNVLDDLSVTTPAVELSAFRRAWMNKWRHSLLSLVVPAAARLEPASDLVERLSRPVENWATSAG